MYNSIKQQQLYGLVSFDNKKGVQKGYKKLRMQVVFLVGVRLGA